MKKIIKILCIILALSISFLLGWRVMPRIWPDIKQNIVYPLFPQLHPESEEEQFLYTPESNSNFGDEIKVSDSLVYYFYKDYCTYCMSLKPLMSALPEQITLPDGSPSKVKLVCLNKVEDKYLQIITDYYEEHNVSEEERYVPAVVIGDRYLFLEEEISGQLLDALVAGEGLQTPLLDGGERIK